MSKPLIIVGNGGHASVLTEILISQNKKIIGFTSPTEDENSFHIPYIGPDEEVLNYHPSEVELVLGVGGVQNTFLRQKLFSYFKSHGFVFSNVIHPFSFISSSVILGEGVQVMAGCIIQTNTKIADNIIINTGAKIDHDCDIKSHVHIAPGVTISGGVTICEGTHIGAGATIIQGVMIEKSCLIGAGSVVIRDVKENSKVLGVPAKEVK